MRIKQCDRGKCVTAKSSTGSQEFMKCSSLCCHTRGLVAGDACMATDPEKILHTSMPFKAGTLLSISIMIDGQVHKDLHSARHLKSLCRGD